MGERERQTVGQTDRQWVRQTVGERERQWGRERHKKSEWMYGCTSMWARETKYQNNERKEDVWEDV